jgi:large subunit ribosomal protein L10
VIAVNKKQREEAVTTLSQKIAASSAGFVIDFQGLSVEASNDLRRQIRKAGSELKVAKNTLLRRAARETDFATMADSFVGPTAVLFVQDNPVPVVKVLKKFIKDNPAAPLKVKGGVLNKTLLSHQDIDLLAELPSRDVLVAQLLGVLTAPMRNLVSVLAEVPRKFLRVLNAVAETKQGQ